MQQQAPTAQHWLPMKLVQLYTEYYQQFNEERNNLPNNNNMSGADKLLRNLMDGLQQAATGKDADSTNNFIKLLVISFFQAYRTIQEGAILKIFENFEKKN